VPLLGKIDPDGPVLIKEIEEFRQFLTKNPRGERKEFLPFFAKHPQLGAYLGTMNDKAAAGTYFATEVSLWGDFTCDLVAGDQSTKAFVFVEFEDASPTSLFQKITGRKNNLWATRVEHGVSQVIDWLFRISSEGTSNQMERDFGARQITPMGLVVVGRSSEVSAYDRQRLDWRSKNTAIQGAKLAILTYDDLLEWLQGRAAMLRDLSRAANP
jgi:hypothetical protein